MESQYTEMGRRIKLRRKELKIKQSEMAEALNVSNNHISSIETGKQKPSLDIFISICEYLNVTPDYLLLGALHSYNVPLDILDKLRLCSQEDIELTKNFVEIPYRIKCNYEVAMALQKSRCITFENRISVCYTFLNEDI